MRNVHGNPNLALFIRADRAVKIAQRGVELGLWSAYRIEQVVNGNSQGYAIWAEDLEPSRHGYVQEEHVDRVVEAWWKTLETVKVAA